MSPSASPANDWPRSTVKTPTAPPTIATEPADRERELDRGAREEPGLEERRAASALTRSSSRPASPCVVVRVRRLGVVAVAGDDEHPSVDTQHVDVVAVELG